MGGHKLANKVAMRAVSSACREAIAWQAELTDKARRVRQPGGVFSVRCADWPSSPSTLSIPSHRVDGHRITCLVPARPA